MNASETCGETEESDAWESALHTMRLLGVHATRNRAAEKIRVCRSKFGNEKWLTYWRTYARATRGFKCVPDSWVELMTSNTSADQP